MRILGSCSTVDLKRVVETVKTNQDPLPAELYLPKGKIALAFVITMTDRGMGLEDVADVKEVLLWDDHRFEVKLFSSVDSGKRVKWKLACARPLPLNEVIRRYQNGRGD